MALECWSDGRRVGGLFKNDGGIRACKCGKYYRLSETIDMGLLAAPKIQEIEVDDNGDEVLSSLSFLSMRADVSMLDSIKSETKSLFQKMKSLFLRQQKKKVKIIKKITVQTPLSLECIQHIPNAINIEDSEMYEIIKMKDLYSDEMILVARERYRMYLNDKYREPFKEYCKDRSLPIPEYNISNEHRENTKAILNAHLKTKAVNWIDVGDLYRELDEFSKAIECFEKSKSDLHSKADLEKLTRATNQKISNPLPI